MELNGIELISNFDKANETTFTLNCTMEEAFALNDSDMLTITNGGDIVKQYGGYEVCSVEQAGAYVRVRAVRHIDSNVATVITAMSSNMEGVNARLDEQDAALMELAAIITEG